MSGKIIAILIVLTAALAGGGMYYLQIYHFYETVAPNGETDVVLTLRGTDTVEPLRYQAFQAIDADSSPIRYRACFEVVTPLADLSGRFEVYERPQPLTAPGWFDCYDAGSIAEALDSGRAQAFLGVRDVTYGIDRIVVITEDGAGFSWHQINPCGAVVFDGDPVPEGCPPPPS